MKRRRAWIAVAIVLAVVLVLCVHRLWMHGRPSLLFCGGAREVGGSCILVETSGSRFVIDCGALGDAGVGVLPPDPEELSFAILTHAHTDHCGMLPELRASGFSGVVYCTEPTARLSEVMLRMMRDLSEQPVPREAFDGLLAALCPVRFGEIINEGNISFQFRRAGHLLGAAFVEIWIRDERGSVRLVVSGDLGSGGSMLLRPIESPMDADYVIVESTYGGVRRGGARDVVQRHEPFAQAVAGALRRGGDVLIPAFTLGKTQEVIATLDCFIDDGLIPAGTIMYVDSPTAQEITGIYRQFRHELSDRAQSFYGDGILVSPYLREVKSRTSLAVHTRRHRPAVFVSSSGDLSHANSPVHLMRMFDDSTNMLCIVGWQSSHSPGARLVAGESPVLVRYRSGKRYLERWISPAIEIVSFDCFSSHADQAGLVSWLSHMTSVRTVFIVHGESDQAEALGTALTRELGMKVEIPRRRERFVLRYFRTRADEADTGIRIAERELCTDTAAGRCVTVCREAR